MLLLLFFVSLALAWKSFYFVAFLAKTKFHPIPLLFWQFPHFLSGGGGSPPLFQISRINSDMMGVGVLCLILEIAKNFVYFMKQKADFSIFQMGIIS